LKGEAGAPRPAAADVGDTPPGTPLPRERLSLEAIIGTRWLNWVGVVTFLLGIAFFLKYAYDRDWIGPSGRTVIAYLAAAAALWIGARGRRRGYLLAADGVTALGFGVLYAATYFGTVRYELVWMPRAMGFVLMILITAAGIRTALRHRSQIIAVMALLGGYLTPVLLSTGKDEGETLVFYLTLLGAGAAGCVIRERWRFVEFLAIAATHVLFLAWFGSHYTPARMALALAGTAVFFSLFTALAVLPAWTGKERGRLEDALALALNAFLAFPLLYFTIEKDHRVALMALTLAGGAVFAIIRLRLSLREEGQSPLSLAALCLAMAFLTIAFPLKLGLWGLPIAWAAEGTALLYLGFLLPNVWMLSGAAAVHFLAGVYLLTHLPLHRAPFIPVLNGAFLSWAFVIAALFFSSALARRDGPELREPWRRRAAVFGVVTYTGAGVALLLLGLREVQESYGLLLNLKAYHATPWHWLLFAAFPFLFALRARCTLADIDSRLTHAAFIVAAAAFVWGLGAYRPAGHLAIINSWFLAGLLLAGSFALGAAIGRRPRGPNCRTTMAPPWRRSSSSSRSSVSSRSCDGRRWGARRSTGLSRASPSCGPPTPRRSLPPDSAATSAPSAWRPSDSSGSPS
jgi:uncharacterized membrane protein